MTAALGTPSAHTQTYRVLHTFGEPGDGGIPYGGLVRDSAGNVYGTGILRGTSNAAVVFKLDTTGKLTVLHNFTGKADGGAPSAIWSGTRRATSTALLRPAAAAAIAELCSGSKLDGRSQRLRAAR